MSNSTRYIAVPQAPAAFTVAHLVERFILRRSPTAPPDETLVYIAMELSYRNCIERRGYPKLCICGRRWMIC